jgi:hypothetical protein
MSNLKSLGNQPRKKGKLSPPHDPKHWGAFLLLIAGFVFAWIDPSVRHDFFILAGTCIAAWLK